MYHLALAYCAWEDGRTGSVPVWALLLLCLSAVAPATGPVNPVGRVGGSLILVVPFLVTGSRGATGPADTAAVLAAGLRYGTTAGALYVAWGILLTMAGVVVASRGAPDGTKSVAGSIRNCGIAEAAPFFPGLLAAHFFSDTPWCVGSLSCTF